MKYTIVGLGLLFSASLSLAFEEPRLKSEFTPFTRWELVKSVSTSILQSKTLKAALKILKDGTALSKENADRLRSILGRDAGLDHALFRHSQYLLALTSDPDFAKRNADYKLSDEAVVEKVKALTETRNEVQSILEAALKAGGHVLTDRSQQYSAYSRTPYGAKPFYEAPRAVSFKVKLEDCEVDELRLWITASGTLGILLPIKQTALAPNVLAGQAVKLLRPRLGKAGFPIGYSEKWNYEGIFLELYADSAKNDSAQLFSYLEGMSNSFSGITLTVAAALFNLRNVDIEEALLEDVTSRPSDMPAGLRIESEAQFSLR